MSNGIDVMGWGVGGLEAESAMFGQPASVAIPEVAGVGRAARRGAGHRPRGHRQDGTGKECLDALLADRGRGGRLPRGDRLFRHADRNGRTGGPGDGIIVRTGQCAALGMRDRPLSVGAHAAHPRPAPVE
ncbi:hypothetical protein IQ782_22150 [Salipiger pacificus]|uniref:Uncharacterized protein n=2 Tax=Salipiger mangrovisoli TaxID=2865933 RepID=A0ABR9X7N9_9RHOB|nr:hypothetical protein [Salipiger mangrovisoli]